MAYGDPGWWANQVGWKNEWIPADVLDCVGGSHQSPPATASTAIQRSVERARRDIELSILRHNYEQQMLQAQQQYMTVGGTGGILGGNGGYGGGSVFSSTSSFQQGINPSGYARQGVTPGGYVKYPNPIYTANEADGEIARKAMEAVSDDLLDLDKLHEMEDIINGVK